MLLNFPLIILVVTIKIFHNVKTLIMLMLFLKQAACSSAASPNFFGGPNILTFVRDNVSNSVLLGTTPLRAQNDKKC